VSYDYTLDPRYQRMMGAFQGMQGHPRYYHYLATMACLHADKNHDYSGGDPLSNLKGCEDIGIPSYIGTYVRLSDKYERFKRWMGGEVDRWKGGSDAFHLQVKDEKIADTLLDQANYSVLEVVLIEEFNPEKFLAKEESPYDLDYEPDDDEEVDDYRNPWLDHLAKTATFPKAGDSVYFPTYAPLPSAVDTRAHRDDMGRVPVSKADLEGVWVDDDPIETIKAEAAVREQRKKDAVRAFVSLDPDSPPDCAIDPDGRLEELHAYTD
jgi:hypothetical protein